MGAEPVKGLQLVQDLLPGRAPQAAVLYLQRHARCLLDQGSDNPSTSVQSSWLADDVDTPPPPPALELTIANTNAAK